jgi:hypothetical protein
MVKWLRVSSPEKNQTEASEQRPAPEEEGERERQVVVSFAGEVVAHVIPSRIHCP